MMKQSMLIKMPDPVGHSRNPGNPSITEFAYFCADFRILFALQLLGLVSTIKVYGLN